MISSPYLFAGLRPVAAPTFHFSSRFTTQHRHGSAIVRVEYGFIASPSCANVVCMCVSLQGEEKKLAGLKKKNIPADLCASRMPDWKPTHSFVVLTPFCTLLTTAGVVCINVSENFG